MLIDNFLTKPKPQQKKAKEEEFLDNIRKYRQIFKIKVRIFTLSFIM